MRVLIGCECSGVVRRAFRERGHDAWSCDLQPADDGSEHHYQCDILNLLISEQRGIGIRHGVWQMAIFHPECTYLNNAAEWALKDPDFERYPGVGYHQKLKEGTLFGAARRVARENAAQFFLDLWNCGIPRIAIENPTGHMNTRPELARIIPQTIQPHQFGDDASKATCLWLRGLPPLCPTKKIPPRLVQRNGKTVLRWSNQTDSGQNKLPPSEDRSKLRAETYPGIARAMAEQWS